MTMAEKRSKRRQCWQLRSDSLNEYRWARGAVQGRLGTASVNEWESASELEHPGRLGWRRWREAEPGTSNARSAVCELVNSRRYWDRDGGLRPASSAEGC